MNAHNKTLLSALTLILEDSSAEPVFPDGASAYVVLTGHTLRLHNEAGEVVAAFQLVPVEIDPG